MRLSLVDIVFLIGGVYENAVGIGLIVGDVGEVNIHSSSITFTFRRF